MTENRKVQLEAGMDVSGVEQGAERGKRAVRDMAQSVVQAGRDAGQGVEGLGQSSERSADKVAKAYGRIESEIRRVTAAAQAAAEGTGRSGEILNKAIAQGLDPGRIDPLLAKLREYEAAQKGVGISAGQMQAALRGVPAQFTDIATSLASGQKPMLVLLQQGGQLKDMFGGAGAAARALGGYILSLVNPYTLAAAAAGGLAAAYYQGSKEADAYARALILTGNAAGTSSGALAGMAVQIEAMGSATQGAAAEALALAAGTGKISGDNLRLVADAALRMQKTAGIAVSETIEQFAELGRAPVTASLKLNETTNHLTESVYRQIKALEDQGRMAEAAALAQSTYADALTSRAGQIEQNLGAIEKIWKGVAAEAKSAWDAMLGVGRTQTLQDRIRELETAQGRGFFTAHRTSEQDAELAALKAQAQAIDDAAAAKAKRNEQEKSGIALAREAEKHLDREAQKQRELIKLSETYNRSAQTPDNTRDYLAAVAGVMEKFTEKAKGARTAVKEVRDEYAELVNKLTAQDAGLSSSFWKDLETLHQQYLKTGDIDAYRRSVELLVTQQKFHQDTVKAAAAAEAEWAKSASAAQQAREKEIRSLEQKAQAAEDELRYYGLARSEIEALIVARLEERRAIESGIDGQEDVVSSLDREIAARRRLRDAYMSREVAAANEKAAQDSAKAWENFSRDIEQSLTDALMRGFESGEGFGENFVKTLQNTLKTAALKIAVQMVVQPVMGSLGQALGYTQGGAGGGGLGNIFSLANNFTGGGGMYGNFATSAAGQSLGLSALVPGIFEEAAALGVGGAVGGGGAALTGLGTALPYIGIGLGLLSLFGGDLFGGKEKPPVAAWTQFPKGSEDWGIPLATPWGDLRFAGQHMGDTEAEVAKLRDAFAPIAQRDFAISSLLSSDENKRIEQAIAGYTTGEMEDYSEAAMRAHFEKRLDLVSDAIGGWVDEIADAFVGDLEGSYTAIATLLSVRGVEGAEELARAFIGTLETAAGEAIVQAQSGTFMDAYINNLNAGGADGSLVSSLSREGETAADTFARLVNDLVGVRAAFDLMGRAALDFSLAAADMASSIIEAAGGAEAFQGKFAAYYAEFYTEQERLAKHTERTAAEFDKLGLAMPDSHAAFRALVDGIDLTTEAGQDLFASLLTLAPAFDVVADASAAAAQQAIQSAQAAAAEQARAAAQLAQDRRALEIELQDALGNGAIAEAMRREDTLAGLDPSLRGLQEQIWSALDAAAAQEALRAAQEAAAEAARRAAEEQARAAEEVRRAWQQAADGIYRTILDLRGDLLGSDRSFAAAQSEFSIASAQARAGNQDAANRLPELARAVAELGKGVAASSIDEKLITARTLASLSATLESLKRFGVQVPAFADGGLFGGGYRVVGEHGPEIEATGASRIYSFDQFRNLMQGGDMAAELRALREELRALRAENGAENRAIVGATTKTARLIERVMPDGDAIATREAA